MVAKMAAVRTLGLVALSLILTAASGCAAREFYVGGRDGWTPNPGEPHNQWAERNRFQVNDTLVFSRYDRNADGVLLVTQGHYDACNTTDPILSLRDHADDTTRFVFPDSGPYFFISADAGRCRAGERLIVVVLAVRNNNRDDSAGNNVPSPPLLPPSPPTPPPPKSSSTAPPLPPAAPKPATSTSSSSPASAPPPLPHSPANASSSPSPAPAVTALAPGMTANGTCEPSAPSASSAVALRAGVLLALCLLAAAGPAIL